MQALEQIAAFVLNVILSVLEINSADILAVGLLDLLVDPHFHEVVPIRIAEKRAKVVEVRKPLLLLPAAIARSAVNKLVKLCGVAYLVDRFAVLELAVELLCSRSARDTRGAEGLFVPSLVERTIIVNVRLLAAALAFNGLIILKNSRFQRIGVIFENVIAHYGFLLN